MTDFLKLWDRRDEVVDDFFAQTNEAETKGSRELSACIKIQCFFRGSRVRGNLDGQRQASLQLQRIFRGFLGRKEAIWRIEVNQRKERMAFFDKMATQLQRIWRGYFSRKYTHSFFQRKAYIKAVVEKGQKLRVDLENSLQRQIEDEQLRQLENEQEEFKKLASNLHHLVSTRSIPGIYNSPYQQDCKPTAFNVPVEDHLKETVRNMPLTTKKKAQTMKDSQSHFGASTDKKGLSDVYRNVKLGVKGPFKPPEMIEEMKQRELDLSVQATSKYDIVKEELWNEYKYSKIERVKHPGFISSVRHKNDYLPSISQGTRYGVTVPRPREEDKSLRLSTKPFHVAVPVNRRFDDKRQDQNITQVDFPSLRKTLGTTIPGQ